MLQMASVAPPGGGIFPPISPITMANVTGESSTTDSLPTTSTSVKTTSDVEKNAREKNSVGHEESTDVNNRENMGKALMQLYGMGQGMNSFPAGVSQANPFLHPTMFSATGRCTAFLNWC